MCCLFLNKIYPKKTALCNSLDSFTGSVEHGSGRNRKLIWSQMAGHEHVAGTGTG